MAEQPTPGQRRLMIYRHHRTLDDACITCGKSEVYCDGVQETHGRRCCGACIGHD